MQTDALERTLRAALREALDREVGPDRVWMASPAAHRIRAQQERRRRWPLRLLAVAAMIGAIGGGAVLVGGLSHPKVEPSPSAIEARAVPCRKPSDIVGAILDCSRDGSRVLIQKDRENLFVIDSDGTETQLTDQLTGYSQVPGSARPVGATISADGARVVFAGLTHTGRNCHDGALFGVDVAGGPVQLLWASHIAENGLLQDPTFSPDGTQIAFVDGYCDWDHHVWVMNADGSGAHEIFSVEAVVGAGHVRALGWSPAGDRIALIFSPAEPKSTFWTFRPDGSDVASGIDGTHYCWPGERC